jgi:glycosyltransferase involved in cell wall biosynthesis
MDVEKDKHFQPLELDRVAGDAYRNLLVRLYHALASAWHLRRFINKNSIQLVHTHETAPLLVAKFATIGKNIPLIVTYHGSSPERVRFFGLVSQLAARHVITPSYRCADELKTKGGVAEKKLKVIGLGVQPPPVFPAEKIVAHRRSLLGPDGKFLVVIIARLTYQKGIDVLIDVVGSVKKQREDIRFVLVGHGPLETEVQDGIEKAGIGSLLRYDGLTEEPYLYLKSADIFLLTSRWEALPITIAEAFQAGLPVIATDTGGVKELVSPLVGRVIQVGDVNGLASSILEVCRDDDLRGKMSENAQKLSQEERFSLPHVHRIFELTYSEILENSLEENNG